MPQYHVRIDTRLSPSVLGESLGTRLLQYSHTTQCFNLPSSLARCNKPRVHAKIEAKKKRTDKFETRTWSTCKISQSFFQSNLFIKKLYLIWEHWADGSYMCVQLLYYLRYTWASLKLWYEINGRKIFTILFCPVGIHINVQSTCLVYWPMGLVEVSLPCWCMR